METTKPGTGRVDALGRPLLPVAERNARLAARLAALNQKWMRLAADPRALAGAIAAERRRAR